MTDVVLWTPNELSGLFTVDSDWLLPLLVLSELDIGQNARTRAISSQVMKSTSQRMSRPRPIWFEIPVIGRLLLFSLQKMLFKKEIFVLLGWQKFCRDFDLQVEFSDHKWRPLKHIFRFESEMNLSFPRYLSFIILLLKMANISAIWEKFRPSTVTNCIILPLHGVQNTITVAVAQTDYTGV